MPDFNPTLMSGIFFGNISLPGIRQSGSDLGRQRFQPVTDTRATWPLSSEQGTSNKNSPGEIIATKQFKSWLQQRSVDVDHVCATAKQHRFVQFAPQNF